MKPPSIYDYPPFDGSEGYGVYAGTVRGIEYPVVRVLNGYLFCVVHTVNIWHYSDGKVVEIGYESGTSNEIAAEIIAAAGLQLRPSTEYTAILSSDLLAFRIIPL